MARCNCDSACSCLIIGADTECIEVNVTGTGSAANPYVISADFICLGPNAGGTLGYSQAVANQSGITTETDLINLSVTVTVAASRRIHISFHTRPSSTVDNDAVAVRIKEGATLLQFSDATLDVNSRSETISDSVSLTPSAGSHTYKITMERSAGTGSVTNNAGSDNPSFILVEDIGAA